MRALHVVRKTSFPHLIDGDYEAYGHQHLRGDLQACGWQVSEIREPLVVPIFD